MKALLITGQLAIASTLIGIWTFKYKQMIQEFKYYRLPAWLRDFTCFSKITIALCLIIGIWMPRAALIASQVLTVFMVFALIVHARVRNPFLKFAPALTVLLVSVFLCYGLKSYL